MKAFDTNYQLLAEMYRDDYFPAFLVDKIKNELQKVIDLLESGETNTEIIQETLKRHLLSAVFPKCKTKRAAPQGTALSSFTFSYYFA